MKIRTIFEAGPLRQSRCACSIYVRGDDDDDDSSSDNICCEDLLTHIEYSIRTTQRHQEKTSRIHAGDPSGMDVGTDICVSAFTYLVA